MKVRAYLVLAMTLMLLLLMIPVPVAVQGASEPPNRHAMIAVSYSLSRSPLEEVRSFGEIDIELYEKRAPITTKNFIDLAEADFFDGIIFHRIIDDFVIQSGDPNSRPEYPGPVDWYDDGQGGSSETIPLESHPELQHHDGAISMARPLGDADGATSQFFICDGPQYRLDDTEENNAERTYRYIDDRGYAVFGQTVSGLEVVREIASVWTDTDPEIETPDPLPTAQAHVHDHPVYDPIIESVHIITPPWERAKEIAKSFVMPIITVAAVIGLGIVAVGGFLWFRGHGVDSIGADADLADLPKAIED